MIGLVRLKLLVVVSAVSLVMSVSCFDDMGLNLSYLGCFKIENEGAGLYAPSGLALSQDRSALWTVSDDTRKVFKLSFDGDLQEGKSFENSGRGLEGIAIEPTGQFFFMMNNDNEIIKLNVTSQEVADRIGLSQIAGYEAVARIVRLTRDLRA
ncbi:hypothetical protein GWN28_04805 [candidate division KSB1 bacterium]|nr:hypothetical protein [Phycisphaerae bacterium]NIU10478.1 hypothetical protein [Phycisphaerae bacterium]NIW17714.1 hypothetical protein [candidate division KSB1 bacterium]NIX30110.1 hypothetical protein [Phycisphaerae bacterium]